MSKRNISTFTAGALLASALTVTGMQSWQAGAAPGDDDTTFVPVPPCRLFDTRPGPDNVGPRSTPISQTETFTTQVTGSNGDCVGIPNDATAVAFNVTTVNPTNDSFLTLFPADLITPPLASNLNWIAGQPPTPNKVDVKLSPDGKVSLYNNTGTVDVIADIVGYYTPSSLIEIAERLDGLEAATDAERNTELTADLASLESRLDAVEAELSTVPDQIRRSYPVFATGSREKADLPASGIHTILVTSIPGGDNGVAAEVHASLTAVQYESGANVRCGIYEDGIGLTRTNGMRWEASGDDNEPGDEGDAGQIAGTAIIRVPPGASKLVELRCEALDDDGDGAIIWGPVMTQTVYSRT